MPMSSSGTCKSCWASVRSLPPLNPVQPNVVSPCRFAHSTARRMFGLLPEPLMAMSRSPGRGQVLELLDEDAIEALVVAPGEDVGRVVGQAEDAQPLLGVVVEVLAAQRALAEVLAEVRGVGAAAAVADDEDEAAALIAVVHGVRQRLDLGGVDAQQFLADPFQKRQASSVVPSMSNPPDAVRGVLYQLPPTAARRSGSAPV